MWPALLELWPFLFFGLLLWAYLGRPVWAVFTSDKSDLPRIKRLFEGEGRVLVRASRKGVHLEGSGRSPPTVFRRYEFDVRRHDGVTKTFTAAVQMTLLGDPALREFDEAARRTFNQGSKTWFKDVESL